MPSQPKRHRTSKLFQCTGYGKCTMTFTRGEHLARHTRKHTGEKPFVCISPNCNKAFSRFDNMMQHTHTHRHEAQHLMQQPYHHRLPPAQPIITTMDKVILRQPTLINHKPAFHPVSAIHSSNTSLSGYSYCSSDNDDDDDDDDNDEVDDEDVGPRLLNSYFEPKVHDSWMPSGHRRRLSVADLCNPMDPSPSKIHQLTHDEVEALQAFGKLCQATC